MDPEKSKRRQSVKVITSEAIMVLAVIVTVIVLAFLVSGYWINSDFKVERQGLLQISSIPTGASVYIDGEESSWLQRTNTSKLLSSGKHTIVLTKDGYDSWSKTVNIAEGLLYRIHYPRLFLNDRVSQSVLNTGSTTIATVSPDHNYLLLINSSLEWDFISLDNENLDPTKIDISGLFSNTADGNSFTGKILSINWDYDSNHVLLKVETNGAIEWILLDVKNPKNNLNLTKEFGGNFSEIQILDNSSNNLLAIQNGNLHKINLSGKSISNVLVENVTNFDHYNQNEIIFSTPSSIGLFKIGDEKILEVKDVSTPAKVALSKFYEDEYITILENNIVSVYRKDDFSEILNFELTFNPEYMKVGHDGEFITMYSGSQIATLDMESLTVREWTIDGEKFGWIDNDMIYTVSNGQLIVYDYDGFNRRVIANNVSNDFPSAITNNKWLYYFSDKNLVRESLTK